MHININPVPGEACEILIKILTDGGEKEQPSLVLFYLFNDKTFYFSSDLNN